ncbi:MAG TPA: class I SAM-dependent methyltransferase [Candidatus Omnitrophota bacterium]|nr:class I SAM-dependent methyltransferase [Candidatus Omnitrophota bacterium]
MNCRICAQNELKEMIDFGSFPISNRYKKKAHDQEETFSLALGQCGHCSTVQLTKSVPAPKLVPTYDWIKYNEPEPHLDGMVEKILKLPGIHTGSTFCGVTFKDDSTLQRFENKGYKKIYRLDMKNDLGIDFKGAGVETIQGRLTPQRARDIRSKKGSFDVVIARHILEHVYDINSFVEALKILTSPNGYIVFEVPDCSRAIDLLDYTTLWEEHTLYFTPETFRGTFGHLGLSLAGFENYPYPFENSLVSICQLREEKNQFTSVPQTEFLRMKRFVDNFPVRKKQLREFLSDYRKNTGKIALFGAGHLACTYVVMFELRGLIEFFVDDDPNKTGLFMAGCGLPIYKSAALIKEKINLCLLSLNPLSEEKVMKLNQTFLEQGGTFASIFPGSKHALQLNPVEARP